MDIDTINPFLDDLKKHCELYINKDIIHSAYIRGSYSRGEFQNNISDIDLIFIFKKPEYIEQLRTKIYNLHSEYIIKEDLDIMFITIYDTLYYNMLYTLKYKSSLFCGNSNIYEYLQINNNIEKNIIPCINFTYYTRLTDPLLKPIAQIPIEIKISRKIMTMMKRTIRAIYEFYILLNKITTYTVSLKEQCDIIYTINNATSYDNEIKEITKNISNNIEYILKNGYDHNIKPIYDNIINSCLKISEIFKKDEYIKLQVEYENTHKNMYSLSLKDFIV